MGAAVVMVIIGICCAAVIYFCIRSFREAKALHDLLISKERLANPRARQDAVTAEQRKAHEDEVVKARDRMNACYSLFANLVSVLPLLGMLGTVVSLLGLAGNMDAAEVPVDKFFGALNTTAFGLVGAVCGKVADAFLSVKVQQNNKETDTLLERNHEIWEQAPEAAAVPAEETV